jgi:hypothetical protein
MFIIVKEGGKYNFNQDNTYLGSRTNPLSRLISSTYSNRTTGLYEYLEVTNGFKACANLSAYPILQSFKDSNVLPPLSIQVTSIMAFPGFEMETYGPIILANSIYRLGQIGFKRFEVLVSSENQRICEQVGFEPVDLGAFHAQDGNGTTQMYLDYNIDYT